MHHKYIYIYIYIYIYTYIYTHTKFLHNGALSSDKPADNDEEAVLSLVLVGLIRQNDLVVAGACRVGLHRPHAQLGLQEEVKAPSQETD